MCAHPVCYLVELLAPWTNTTVCLFLCLLFFVCLFVLRPSGIYSTLKFFKAHCKLNVICIDICWMLAPLLCTTVKQTTFCEMGVYLPVNSETIYNYTASTKIHFTSTESCRWFMLFFSSEVPHIFMLFCVFVRFWFFA